MQLDVRRPIHISTIQRHHLSSLFDKDSTSSPCQVTTMPTSTADDNEGTRPQKRCNGNTCTFNNASRKQPTQVYTMPLALPLIAMPIHAIYQEKITIQMDFTRYYYYTYIQGYTSTSSNVISGRRRRPPTTSQRTSQPTAHTPHADDAWLTVRHFIFDSTD